MATEYEQNQSDLQGIGVHGILAPVVALDRWLRAVLVVLIVVCALRYVLRHPLDATAVFILAGAAGLAVVYSARGLLRGGSRGPTVWVAMVLILWVGLTLVAPSFAWTAVPLAFAALQVLSFRYAAGVVVLMTVVVSVAWNRITDDLDPTIVVGPIGIALVTVIAYRALDRESRTRQQLLDQLTAAQADLVVAQRRSGALAERTRISREIHDSVGQGLSSINLLLNAAEQDWQHRPDRARHHVQTASATARDGLEEVRRVVRDLAPEELESDHSGAALSAALEQVVQREGHGLDVQLRVYGVVRPVPAPISSAIVRSARGSLANVVEHAAATRAVISLTYHPDEVLLDVRDDGQGFELPPRLDSQEAFDPGEGFDPDKGLDRPKGQPAGVRGRGLRGIRERAAELGGRAEIESAPGEGTTVSVCFPLFTETVSEGVARQ